MRGTFSFTFVPIRSRTVEAFAATDPWHGGRPAQWSLEVFRMVNERIEHIYTRSNRPVPSRSEGNQLGRSEVLGLLNTAEGRPRLLPIALTQLWQEGTVAAKDLPRMMALIEPRTVTSDFFSQTARWRRWIVGYFLVLALLAAGAAIVVSVTSGRHRMAEVSADSWLARPLSREQEVSVTGLVTIDGHVPTGPVRLPPDMYSEGSGGTADNTLAWYKSAQGERLLMMTPLYADGIERGAKMTSIVGSVLKTATVRLSPAVLQAVAAKVPGLQTDYITCEGWRWEYTGGGLLGDDPTIILFPAGVFTLLAGLFYLQHRRSMRRIAWFRQELAKLSP